MLPVRHSGCQTLYPESASAMANNVYWFSEINKTSIPIAGGKGANLGEMFQLGLPVPDGFVISSEAYFNFVKATKIDQLIASTLAGLDEQDSDKLDLASDTIKNAILAEPMPNDIRTDLVRAYNKLCGVSIFPLATQEALVAVRSSATAEDLPEASFAGQQATFLNVKGADMLVDAVRSCWASLFEARAIYYRITQHFDHNKVGLCAVVQKMVDSEKSGVMFTVNPITKNRNEIMIEAAIGLGEAVVSGSVTPDNYLVSKDPMQIAAKTVSKQEFAIMRGKSGTGSEKADLAENLAAMQKLTDEQIVTLAGFGKKIEEHYGAPQDIEWAVEKGKIFIVQSRNITTLVDKKQEVKAAVETNPQTIPDTSKMQAQAALSQNPDTPKPQVIVEAGAAAVTSAKAKPILKGLGASPGTAWGPVRLIYSPKEIHKVKQGDVLVTEMTSPDFVPAMKRAAAIVTNNGGQTCHAAIVSRELGIPCIVGTRTATIDLKEDQIITVNATQGVVFEGKPASDTQSANNPTSKAMEKEVASDAFMQEVVRATKHLSGPQSDNIVTGTKLYVNLAEAENADKIASKHVDGVGLFRAEFIIAGFGKHPKAMLKQGKREEFIDMLSDGMRKMCAAFYPRPVIYRATDFKTNEYKNLEGGEEFEPKEENPMIGFRGCFRYIKDPEVFNMELEAIKRVRETYGMKNLWLMIPFVRTLNEFKACKKLVDASGITNGSGYDFKLGIMCEIPSTVILAEEFCKAGAQFFSIGSNDLTQLTLGLDRDNPIVAEDFDERDPSVLESIRLTIERCHKHGVPVGICGQAPSVYPEFAEAIVAYGIDSISCNPDVIEATRKTIASAEQRFIMKKARGQ